MSVRPAPVIAMAALSVISLALAVTPATAQAQANDLEAQVANAAAAIARGSGTARGVRLDAPFSPPTFVRTPTDAATGAVDSVADEPGSSGFLSSLNELLAPKEVLLDLTRLGSPDYKRNLVVLGAGLGLAALARDDVDEAFVGVREPVLDDVSESMSFLGGHAFLYPALATSFFIGKAIDKPDVTRTAAQMTQALLLTDTGIDPGRVFLTAPAEGKEWLALIEYLRSMKDTDGDVIPDIDIKYRFPLKSFFPVNVK